MIYCLGYFFVDYWLPKLCNKYLYRWLREFWALTKWLERMNVVLIVRWVFSWIVSRVIFFVIGISLACFSSGSFSLRLLGLCSFMVRSLSMLFCQGSLIPNLFVWNYLFLSFESWRAVVYTIGSRMNLFPIFSRKLINIDVIFLFSDILNTTEHEYVILENQHRMTSSLWRSVLRFNLFPLFCCEWKFPEIVQGVDTIRATEYVQIFGVSDHCTVGSSLWFLICSNWWIHFLPSEIF